MGGEALACNWKEGGTLSKLGEQEAIGGSQILHVYIRRSSVSLTWCSYTAYRPCRQCDDACEPICYMPSSIHDSTRGRLHGQSSSYK